MQRAMCGGTVLLIGALLCVFLGAACAESKGPGKRRGGLPGSRPDPAPALGAHAPNFKLKTLEGDREVELASFKGRRPVVLVFGSYT